ncbi:MAG: hypothetical protein Q7S36_00255 [Candidatus Liptonbacteria bacterium]|nr:hypothetical protein [Candidatus Liptonbacteria bacterium]
MSESLELGTTDMNAGFPEIALATIVDPNAEVRESILEALARRGFRNHRFDYCKKVLNINSPFAGTRVNVLAEAKDDSRSVAIATFIVKNCLVGEPEIYPMPAANCKPPALPGTSWQKL